MNTPITHLLVLGSLTLSLSACSALGRSASSPETDESSERPAESVKVQDEVPSVENCHTDTQVCPLEEPLQPGLGCFCKKTDGTNEIGAAGE